MDELGWVKQARWCELVGESDRQAQFKRLGDAKKEKPPLWREGYHWKTILGKPWIHYERVQEWLENWNSAA